LHSTVQEPQDRGGEDGVDLYLHGELSWLLNVDGAAKPKEPTSIFPQFGAAEDAPLLPHAVKPLAR
jgi:hypothetical protein